MQRKVTEFAEKIEQRFITVTQYLAQSFERASTSFQQPATASAQKRRTTRAIQTTEEGGACFSSPDE
jgi:hypothetical protein